MLEFLIKRLKCCNLNESVNITASLQSTTLLIFSAHSEKRVRKDLLNNYINEYKKFMRLQSVQNTTSTSLLLREIHCVLEILKEMNTHAILCHLVKPLNHVAYEHVLIKRVTEEVKRMLTAVNVSRVFT